jgi:hypothetical protein
MRRVHYYYPQVPHFYHVPIVANLLLSQLIFFEPYYYFKVTISVAAPALTLLPLREKLVAK